MTGFLWGFDCLCTGLLRVAWDWCARFWDSFMRLWVSGVFVGFCGFTFTGGL